MRRSRRKEAEKQLNVEVRKKEEGGGRGDKDWAVALLATAREQTYGTIGGCECRGALQRILEYLSRAPEAPAGIYRRPPILPAWRGQIQSSCFSLEDEEEMKSDAV